MHVLARSRYPWVQWTVKSSLGYTSLHRQLTRSTITRKHALETRSFTINTNYSTKTHRSSIHHHAATSFPDPSLLKFHPEVLAALSENRPIVALESTIITHGMPFPSNLETAHLVESTIRAQGAVPATIALMDGKIHVGCSERDLHRLAESRHAIKTSRRDFAYVLADKSRIGATTVSGTMMVADWAGIKVFVTGGIGGVHRGGHVSLDVSADLTELGRTPVAVVCAGAKSILDIPLTLEYLETQGVSVATLSPSGKPVDFPAFYTPHSGIPSPMVVSNPLEAAKMVYMNEKLALKSGMVFGVPIPGEEAADAQRIQNAVEQAVMEAEKNHVKGKEVTPFILARVKELTAGDSLRANIALIKNNAVVGGQIAKQYSMLMNNEPDNSNDSVYFSAPTSTPSSHSTESLGRPVVIGLAVVDITSRSENTLLPNTSNPGFCKTSLGGVGRNVFEACARTGGNPKFLSVVGEDAFGDLIKTQMASMSMDTSAIQTSNATSTAVYNAVLDQHGDLYTAIADMAVAKSITPEMVKEALSSTTQRIVCFDANVSTDVMNTLLEATKNSVHLFYEPTSVPKSVRLFDTEMWKSRKTKRPLSLISPDRFESVALAEQLGNENGVVNVDSVAKKLNTESKIVVSTVKLASQLSQIVCTKLGPEGVLVGFYVADCDKVDRDFQGELVRLPLSNSGVFLRKFVPEEVVPGDKVVSVTGAGDSMVGTLISGFQECSRRNQVSLDELFTNLKHFAHVERIIRGGMKASVLSVKTDLAVSNLLTPQVFE